MRERSVAVNDSPPSPPPFCFAGIGEVSFVCISGRLINDMELYEEPLVFASLLAVSQFVLVPLPPFSFFKFVAQSDEIASAAPSPPRFSLSQDSVLIRKYSARFTNPLPVLVGHSSPPIQ